MTEGSYDDCGITVTNASGSAALAIADFTVDLSAPSLSTVIITIAADVVMDLAGNGNVVAIASISQVLVLTEVTAVTNPTNNTTPEYVFTSTQDGTLSYAGGCSSSVTTAIAGSNTINLNTLTEGSYAGGCSSTTTAIAGSNTINFSTLADDSYGDCMITITAGSESDTLERYRRLP